MLFTAPGQHASGGEQRASWATAIARDPDPDRGWGSQRNNVEYCNITSSWCRWIIFLHTTADTWLHYWVYVIRPANSERIRTDSIIFVLKKKHVYKRDSSFFWKNTTTSRVMHSAYYYLQPPTSFSSSYVFFSSIGGSDNLNSSKGV